MTFLLLRHHLHWIELWRWYRPGLFFCLGCWSKIDLEKLEFKEWFFFSLVIWIQFSCYFTVLVICKNFIVKGGKSPVKQWSPLPQKKTFGSETKVQNFTYSKSSDTPLIKLLFIFIFSGQLVSWPGVSEYENFPTIDLLELGWIPNCSFSVFVNKFFSSSSFWITLSSSWNLYYGNMKQKKFSHKLHRL